ncbi:hypothetical protein [Bradyrhizobium symbiodeficiens]|uniref:hypothetical protein n=1 Tax=Bradyrhizobium symbiodeficiens TaxID=1404367 RepID=UPI00140FD4E0|nr:hypothetical protein [Bradyrhizobium symbiodeficiens]QIP01732.1 hypothetical protein HAU86_18905 [Bradyrhizobium symbiodeficiens]
MSEVKKWVGRSVGLLILVIATWSVLVYEGNRFIFSSFSVAVFAIGYLAVRSPIEYSHFFLGIAWFIGFWGKFVFHHALGRPYYEMSGSFDGASASWDSVLLVIGVGAAGYLAGRLAILPVVGSLTASLLERQINPPRWWATYRNLCWLMAAVLVAATLVLNHELGILVRGYVAQLVLPWPFGGLFAWMTDIGLALLLALLTAWDRQFGYGVIRGFAALCIEGMLVSVSTLSRGVYFFHTLPPLVTEGVEAAKGRRLQPVIVLFAIWVVVGIASPSASTFLRLFGQDAVPITQADLDRSAKISRPMFEYQTANGLWEQFLTMGQFLLIDRWTGLEGVMATVAYPEKSQSLLAEAATQRRTYGVVDVYTKKISGSTFNEENAKQYHFATLAGPIAFLYFSGSLVVVFFGMACIAVIMSATELLWRWLVRDRLLVAMSGLYLALIVMQLSGGLVQAATGPLTVTGAFVAIWLMGRIGLRPLAISM